MDPQCDVTSVLGKYFPFELAVGKNGLAWVKSAQPITTIIITNILSRLDSLTKLEVEKIVAQAALGTGNKTVIS